jgi:hypothetical protein
VAKRLARHFTFGRSRVLTPVPPDRAQVFFQRWYVSITDKANAGSVSTSQYLPPSSPYLSPGIFPSVWLKRLWKASATPLRGVSFFFGVDYHELPIFSLIVDDLQKSSVFLFQLFRMGIITCHKVLHMPVPIRCQFRNASPF